MVKELSAKELEKKMILDEKEFDEKFREKEQEILDKIDAEIKELTEISKKDELGF